MKNQEQYKILEKRLKECYGIDVKHCEIREGEKSNVLYVHYKNHRYVLKRIDYYYDDYKLNEMNEACIYVRESGLGTPVLLPTIQGKLSFTVNDERWILYPWIDGNSFDGANTSKNQLLSSARACALIIGALSKLPARPKNCAFQSDNEFLCKTIIEMKRLLNIIHDKELKTLLIWKVEQVGQLRKQDLSYIDKLTWANTHGDYHIEQQIFHGDEVVGVIDF